MKFRVVREINLRESIREERMYNSLAELVKTAFCDESEVRRKTAAKTIHQVLGNCADIWISRGDCIDNQLLLRGELYGGEVSIYIGDKPKEYQGKPSNAHNFDMRKV